MVKTQKFVLAYAKALKLLAEISKAEGPVADNVINYLAEYTWNKKPDVRQLWPDKNVFVTFMVWHAKYGMQRRLA